MRKLLVSFTLAAALGAPRAAVSEEGAIRRQVEIQRSRHEVSVDLGYAAGFGGQLGSPSGLRVSADYAYRFHPHAWFDLQVGNTFGFGGKDGRCVGSIDAQCYRGGWDLSLAVGARLKWQARIPLMLELPLLVGVDVLYNRDCGDNGASFPVFRPGLRAKYYVTPRIGVGAGVNLAMGVGIHSGGSALCRATSYTDFYGQVDFMIGGEFLL